MHDWLSNLSDWQLVIGSIVFTLVTVGGTMVAAACRRKTDPMPQVEVEVRGYDLPLEVAMSYCSRVPTVFTMPSVGLAEVGATDCYGDLLDLRAAQMEMRRMMVHGHPSIVAPKSPKPLTNLDEGLLVIERLIEKLQAAGLLTD